MMRSDVTPPIQSADTSKLPTRQRVLALLSEPRCAREIRERLPGTKRKQIETALQRLAQDRLIVCVTQEIRQSRLYQRTYLGKLLVFEILGEINPSRCALSEEELYIRAYIQAGRYRRLVLRAMNDEFSPRTARELRKSILPVYQRIGMGHTHQALRELEAKHIITRDGHGRWSLTKLGKKLHAIDLDGLPERPTISRPIWEQIKPAEQQVKQENPQSDEGELHE